MVPAHVSPYSSGQSSGMLVPDTNPLASIITEYTKLATTCLQIPQVTALLASIAPSRIQKIVSNLSSLTTINGLEEAIKTEAKQRVSVLARFIFIYAVAVLLLPITFTAPSMAVGLPIIVYTAFSLLAKNSELKILRICAQNMLDQTQDHDISERARLGKVINRSLILEWFPSI